MSDRVRTGEILAAIGAVGLTILLIFGAWFSYSEPLPGGRTEITGSVSALHLGWFAIFIAALAALAGILFLVRVLTGTTTDRAILQAPVAFAASVLALLVVGVRALIFPPDAELPIALGRLVGGREVDTTIALGGWLGLLSLLLIAVGSWRSMADERTGTKAAQAQTDALLDPIPVRPAPPTSPGSTPEPEAEAVAQDQFPDASEPADPTEPPTGATA